MQNFVHVASSTDKNAEDNIVCFAQPLEHKCKSLEFVLSTIILKKMFWIDHVFLDGNYSSSAFESLTLEDIASVTLVKVTCVSACTLHLMFHFWCRYYHDDFKIVFENVTFGMSTFVTQNVQVTFAHVDFFNSKITDKAPRAGEFGEMYLMFNHTTFKEESIIRLHNTHYVRVEAIKSVVHNSTWTIHSSHLWLAVSSTRAIVSNVNTKCHVFMSAFIFKTHFSGKGGNKQRTRFGLQLEGKSVSLHIVETTIENIVGGVSVRKSNAGLLESWMRVEMSNCIFQSITNYGSAGAVYVLHDSTGPSKSGPDTIRIRNTSFVENSLYREGFQASTGGAIHVKSSNVKLGQGMAVSIENSVFVDNIADDGGGAIYLHTSESAEALKIENCTFVFQMDTFEALKGIFVLSFSSVSIEQSNFKSTVTNNLASIVELQMASSASAVISLELEVECLPWYDLVMSTAFGPSLLSRTNVLQKIILFCSACKPSFYIPFEGTFLIVYHTLDSKVSKTSRSNSENDHLGCVECPQGAQCPGNQLTAMANFWGYRNEKGFVFQQCPSEYCCAGTVENSCTSYNNCANNRDGTLCGACKQGYSLSVMSFSCMKNSLCTDNWLWVVAILGAVSYMLWYTFKGNILGVPGKVLKKILRHGNKQSQKEDQGKSYFGIMTYFVQASAAMRLHINFESERNINTFFSKIEAYTSIFLSIELSYFPADICSVKDLNTTEKTMLKFFFMVGIYFSWLLMFGILLTSAKVAGRLSAVFHRATSKLIDGLVEIIKYTYGGFTDIVFYSLTYVVINNTNVWLHDGTVDLLSKWQVAMVLFAGLFVIPYPFMLYLGLKMLEKKLICANSFLLGCIFPLPFSVHWLYFMIKIQITQDKPSESKIRDVWLDEKSVDGQDEMLDRFRGGYRRAGGGAQYWESVMILRRLLLGSTGLFPSAFFQMILCVSLCVLYLAHHIYIQPFAHTLSNRAETVSLVLLCAVAVINFGKSIFLYLGVNPQGFQVETMRHLGLLETMFILFLIFFIVVSEISSSIKERKAKVLDGSSNN